MSCLRKWDFSRRIILILLECSCFASLHAQTLVLDTLVVPLRFSPIQIALAIDSLRDERECDDALLLDYGEITRFLFIPIDQKICADLPIAQTIVNAFEWISSDSGKSVRLGLKHLDFYKEKHFLFFHQYHLYASVRVYSSEAWVPLAEWVYDCQRSRWVKGISLREWYQSLFQDFVHQLGKDLSSPHIEMFQKNMHFRENPWMRLFVYGEWTRIPNGFLLDGSIDFLFPEMHSSFLQNSGVLRYRNEKRFESIEWAIFSDSFFHRIHSLWLFRMASQGFWGINRWKDVKRKSHTLYDIFILDCSLALGIHFQSKTWRGPVFGLGIRGDASYVYSLDFRILPGYYIQFGWQL